MVVRLKRLIKSFDYAARGLKKTYKEEQNFQIHVCVAALVLAAAAITGVDRVEIMLLVLAIGLVLLMEIANSAIERITDILKPRLSVYVKEIKDITAAGVLVSSLIAVIIGILVFWPYIFS